MENNLFLLDSGAHSLYTKKVINKKHSEGFTFYESEEFWNYVDSYCEFVIENKEYIDIYVSVDVIFNPEMSVKVQEYIEDKYNLKPLPVVHFGEDLKYLDLYLEKGYDYIGIGGLGQEVHKTPWKRWGDQVFSKICNKEGLPKIKTHGFAVTSHDLLVRYPWHSVDATSWKIRAGYGLINMPLFKNGKFDYLAGEVNIGISTRQPRLKDFNGHYFNFSKERKKIVDRYIEQMGFKIGKSIIENDEEKVIEEGLCNSDRLRTLFNIRYYKALEEALTKEGVKFCFSKKNRRLF